ncbi:MAG: RNA-binding protein [Gammaproteobacteria bacterium]|jgi:ribosome-associated heat shock protein Hsp15|nr:RNA-binding protein [Gammaproteobacteria bacterium]MBT3892373.1 RNA-binding protein [Gammaproteobacteria bacterium]MBT4789216.1 RNA-binding protein [Gammaproteobacteria bacterium]MBT6478818.1 RNA-binding protein [Gammaproteobacteria bacterium]HIJ31108.1 RNA-binding protein [Gammaproteobacteria bacterium]
MNEELPLRLDKWLWAARFFKTRKLATDAISGGKVHLNGHRIKPSRTIKIGDRLEIRRGETFFEVFVEGINKQRRPASEAQQLYRESEKSLKDRQAISEQKRLEVHAYNQRDRRPDKRQRRKILEVKNRI